MTDFALENPTLPERERKQGALFASFDDVDVVLVGLDPEVIRDCRVCKLVYPDVWKSCTNRQSGASGCRQIINERG